MKYTERLKLAIAADILFMCVLAILSVRNRANAESGAGSGKIRYGRYLDIL